MNIKFDEKMSDDAFTLALNESTVVQNWLINHISGYERVPEQVTLAIGIDPWTKTEKPSFGWAIYSQPVDNYGLVVPNSEMKRIINGGLIYRGDNNYSSHT